VLRPSPEWNTVCGALSSPTRLDGRYLVEGVMGAANWSEVLQKASKHGAEADVVARLLTSFGISVTDVTREDAQGAADLWRARSTLSLADRLCLALGLRLGEEVVTLHAAWLEVPAGPSVRLINRDTLR